ncbi:dihydroorotate oxidase [Candidatus Woesearchaeota archaeon]|nr:dihydroorotate oxidase [Candidatus Woesearchaeota archaeon]
MTNLKTTIGGIPLETYFFNASGPKCTTIEHLEALGASKSGVILSKSCTYEPREGNPEPRYKELNLGSINSMGLPNLGYMKYGEFAPILKNKFKKPYLVSVSGLKLEDNMKIINHLNTIPEIDAYEVNLSCPNIVGKPQVCYDFEQTEVVLREITKISKKPLGVKLSPYFDFVHFEQMAAILNKYNIKFVTCINSVGNALFIDPETESVVIKPKGGFGGLGGAYIKPIALANVRKFRELLRADIDIIGVGGIQTGVDAFEFLLAGASAVQVGTTLQKEGPTCFERLDNELRLFLEKKGYASIDDAKGKLKIL